MLQVFFKQSATAATSSSSPASSLLTSRVDYLRRPKLAARADPNPLYSAADAAPIPRVPLSFEPSS
jgi:hypothetical protein